MLRHRSAPGICTQADLDRVIEMGNKTKESLEAYGQKANQTTLGLIMGVGECKLTKMFTAKLRPVLKQVFKCLTRELNTKPGVALCAVQSISYVSEHCRAECLRKNNPKCITCSVKNTKTVHECYAKTARVNKACADCASESDVYFAQHCAQDCSKVNPGDEWDAAKNSTKVFKNCVACIKRSGQKLQDCL